MKRRQVLGGLGLMAAGPLLASCSSGSSGGSSGSKSATVNMWVYPVLPKGKNEAFWGGVTKDFEQANPGVKVTVTQFPWANRDQKLATAIVAGKQPDVVYLIPDQLPVYAKSIVPATDYLQQSQLAQYRDGVIKSVSYEGKALGAPILLSVLPTVCNKKVFQDSGVSTYPGTWDDLLTDAPKFKKHGYYATAIPADTEQTLNNSWYLHLWAAGGDVYAPDGKTVAFNSPAGLAALQFEKKLVDGGFVPTQALTKLPPTGQGAVAQGKVACLYTDGQPQLDVQYWGKGNVVVKPPLADGTKPLKTYGTIGSFVMMKGANQSAAGKWIQYITSPDVMTKYLKLSGYFSPRKDVGPLYAKDPILGPEEKILGSVTITAGPIQPTARAIMGVLAPQIQAALLGKKSPQQALADGEKAANALIQQKG